MVQGELESAAPLAMVKHIASTIVILVGHPMPTPDGFWVKVMLALRTSLPSIIPVHSVVGCY